MFFHRTPWFIQKVYPTLTWRKPTNDRVLYLTFDDGPIQGLTESILDTLEKCDVKATFFCVGQNLVNNNEIAQRAISEGHQLANHTYNHFDGWKTANESYYENINLCTDELLSLGQTKLLFRPPYGKITRNQIVEVSKKYDIIMWDVLTGDYSSKVTPEECLKNSIKTARRGSIVLFHDNVKAEKNVTYALPRFLEYFLDKDYQFKLV